MVDEAKERLAVDAMPGYEPEIGRLLWMLEQSRERTSELLDDLGDADLAWAPAPHENSIGALLYHIAAIEADWLYVEVLQADEFPLEIVALFPDDVRDEGGQLAPVRRDTLAQYRQRLAAVRRALLDTFQNMTVSELRRPRELADYVVTPEWVLHHLMQHEAQHRGEIGMLRWLQAPQPDRQ